jgi:predicted nucleic acid-binding protein
MNLVDTSGWIEFFFDGPNAAYFAKPIEKTKELLVPTICLYEVFKKVNVAGNEAQALQAVAQMREGHVVDLTEPIALSASLISIKHKLPMADSMIYATGLANNAVLWTQDIDFADLPGVKYKESRTKT